MPRDGHTLNDIKSEVAFAYNLSQQIISHTD